MGMETLVLVALAGLAASLVDGALGMGFGPTSATILLAAGLTPAAVSTTVNLAKVFTGAAGGIAHWRFGNVDRRLVVQLAGPGCLGVVIGVTLLANIDGDRLRPWLAALLLVVGARIVIRFSRPDRAAAGADAGDTPQEETVDRGARGGTPAGFDRRGIGLAALLGGVTNGLIGAWGPVVTPVLLHRDGLEPRVAIGSVNTAEIAVALAASGSLAASLGGAGVEADALGALLVGGVVAAPLAAWVIRYLAPHVLGVATGGLLVLTNLRQLTGSAGIGDGRWGVYGVAAALCVVAVLRPRLAERAAAARAAVAPPSRSPLVSPEQRVAEGSSSRR